MSTDIEVAHTVMQDESKIPRDRLLIYQVTLVVALFYLLFTVAALLRHDGNPLWFVWLGERYSELDPNGRVGYDGQTVFYLATKGAEGIAHLDSPPYRLQRILFPLVVGMLSLGQPALAPWVMIGINGLAIVLTTYLLARWLATRSLSPWYALTYGCYVGTFLAYSRALIEPLTFLLAAGGMLQWKEKRYGVAAALLAAATLGKETAVLFVGALVLAELAARNWRAIPWLLAALVPLSIWQSTLAAALGQLPLTAGPRLVLLPLEGILPHLTSEPGRISALLFVGIPALVLVPIALSLLWKDPRAHAPWLLLLQSLLILLMPLAVYDHVMHAGRNAAGLVLATVFVAPEMHRLLRSLFLVGWTAPTAIWIIPVLRWAPWLSEI